MKRKPLKRHSALQGVSREHHQALMLVFNLKKGLEKGIQLARLTAYLRWFFKHYFEQHLAAEEATIFPLLGNKHPFIKQALEEHRAIRAYLNSQISSESELLAFAQLLEKHIRFEERELFELMQKECEESELIAAANAWEELDFCLLYPDPFWQAY